MPKQPGGEREVGGSSVQVGRHSRCPSYQHRPISLARELSQLRISRSRELSRPGPRYPPQSVIVAPS